MTAGSASTSGLRAQPFAQLSCAVDRHLTWTCDFARAGDLGAAMDALRDAHAISAELTGMGGARPGHGQ
jgi:hypothetical protein